MLVLVASSGLSYRKYLQHKAADERTITSPAGINSLKSVRIDERLEELGKELIEEYSIPMLCAYSMNGPRLGPDARVAHKGAFARNCQVVRNGELILRHQKFVLLCTFKYPLKIEARCLSSKCR